MIAERDVTDASKTPIDAGSYQLSQEIRSARDQGDRAHPTPASRMDDLLKLVFPFSIFMRKSMPDACPETSGIREFPAQG